MLQHIPSCTCEPLTCYPERIQSRVKNKIKCPQNGLKVYIKNFFPAQQQGPIYTPKGKTKTAVKFEFFPRFSMKSPTHLQTVPPLPCPRMSRYRMSCSFISTRKKEKQKRCHAVDGNVKEKQLQAINNKQSGSFQVQLQEREDQYNICCPIYKRRYQGTK